MALDIPAGERGSCWPLYLLATAGMWVSRVIPENLNCLLANWVCAQTPSAKASHR